MPIQDFKLDTGLQVTGSATFASSVSSSGGFTGSLLGTASYGQDANLLDGLDSSAFALTGSTNYFKASQIVSGNLTVTASLTASSLTASDLNIDYIDFVPQATDPTQQTGRVFVDNVYNEVNTWTDVTGVKLLQGQQLVLRAKCTEMATFTKGQVVKINGGTGANATFVTASWDNDSTSADTLGFLMNSGVTNEFAYIIINGYLTGINTAGYTPGQVIFLSSSGNYTNTTPTYPYHEVRLGQVVRAHANVGSVFVRVQNGYELGELHDVYTGSLSPGDLLVYEDSVTTQWTNKKQLTGSYGLTGSLTASVGLSGALGLFPILTGSSISGTTAQYTTISGSNISGALIGTLNGVSAILAGTNLTASTVATVRTINLTSSINSGLTLLTSTTGNFTILSGTTTTGSTATFTTITGSTITGSTLSYTTLNTTQMTSSGKIVVDNGLTIGNGPNSVNTNVVIGSDALRLNPPLSGNNVAIGYQSLYNSAGGTFNTALGTYALYGVTTGFGNIGIGYNCGNQTTVEQNNIFIGNLAGQLNRGSFNLLFGSQAGQNVQSSNNVAFGYYALNSHKGTGGNNFALGTYSIQNLISGSENIGMGINTLYGVTNGDGNLAIGSRAIAPLLTFAFANNVTASYNTAIGYSSLGAMLSGTENLSIGYNSTLYLGTGSQNSGIGTSVLASLRTGSANTVIGYRALSFLQTGSANVAVGNFAGSSILTGSGNVIIGSATGINNADNNIYIADGAGNLRMFVSGNGNVGIGTSSPTTQLDVRGTGSFYSIKFPSNQSSSNNPNTLDDYEEGTWTPSFTGSSTTNFTYSTNTATYTKIGNTVYIKGILGVSLTGSSAGTLTIGTLPFTSDTPLMSVFTGDMYNFSAGITGSINCTLGSTTSLVLYKYVGGNRTSISVTEMKNNCEYLFSGFYTTTL